MFQFLGRLYDCSVGAVIDSLYNDVDGVRVLRTLARKLLPAVMGHQSDIFFSEVTFTAFVVAVLFLRHNMAPFERKYRMVARLQGDGGLLEMKQNEQVLPKVEAEAIFKLHLKAKKLSNILNIVCNGFTTPFYNLMIAINWTGSVADVKACLWITSTLWYFILNLYIAISCFVFNCRYLRVRQQTQMCRLRELIAANNRVLAQSKNGSPRVKHQAKLFFCCSWSRISSVNRRLNDLGLQIVGYNGFWSRYLTVLIGGFTVLVAYMAFLAIKLDINQNENLIAVAFLCYFICLIFSLFVWITLECSVLVNNNKEILKLQRAFTMHTSLAGGIPRRAAIKFDHIEADSKSIGKVGFQLLDSLQINSKVFELLIFYISSIFMKCVRNEF